MAYKNPEDKKRYDRQWVVNNRDKVRARDKRYYDRHREEKRKRWRAWYLKNRERNIATRLVWQRKNKRHLKEYNLRPEVVKRRNESSRRATAYMRDLVIRKYGERCACCKESNIKFLTIDHIHGNGNKHRNEIKINGGKSFYYWLRRRGYPKGFQVLCMNCNWGRAICGICPHKVKCR